MVENSDEEIIEGHWLSWCRLCAKDDVRGNVKVFVNENCNAWNSVLVMAIRRYFDVHMRLEDELSSVLCKECYTLISELIDFAEHVNKVQAIFEILRRQDNPDVEVLRHQYGLREGDWTHIIKPVSEIEINVSKRLEENAKVTKENGFLLEVKPKQEVIILDDSDEDDQIKPNESENEKIVNHLPIEQILVDGWNDNDKSMHASSELIETNNMLKIVSKDAIGVRKGSLQCENKLDEELSESSVIDINEAILPTNDRDIDMMSLPEAPSFSSFTTNPEVSLHYSVSSDEEDEQAEEPNRVSKRKNMKCKWCDKIYHNPASYRKHLSLGCRRINQRPKIDKNTHCDLCDKTLSSAAALKLHKEGMHENAKPYICDHCGKQLKTITALNEHVLVHSDDRPFNCTICRAGFKNKARLKVHYQTHEEPSFICNICGKKLQTRRTWNMHKLVHSEERKFKCDVCGALFKRSKTLKTHLLSHTGLRPYICNYCGQTFACNANCRAHKQKKHPEKLNSEEREGLATRLSVPTLKELRVMSQKIPKENSEKSKSES